MFPTDMDLNEIPSNNLRTNSECLDILDLVRSPIVNLNKFDLSIILNYKKLNKFVVLFIITGPAGSSPKIALTCFPLDDFMCCAR